MKKILIPALLCALILACCKTSEPSPAASQTGSSSGEILFRGYCSSCHGLDGRGKGPVAPVLNITPPDLTALRKRKGTFTYVEIASYIDGRTALDAHGRDMPVWGRWFGDELGEQRPVTEELISGNLLALVLYLESIQE